MTTEQGKPTLHKESYGRKVNHIILAVGITWFEHNMRGIDSSFIFEILLLGSLM